MLLTGAFPIHDLPDLGVDLGDRDRRDDGGFVTVAGLILARLGHIPTGPGEASIWAGIPPRWPR